MSRVRAFLAIHLPLDIVEKARAVQVQLRERTQRAGMKVVWVPPPNMHMTLKFLAEIPEESIWAIRDTLHPMLAARAAFPVTLCGAGAFPDARHPRVLWIGVHSADDALPALARELDATLATLGFAEEARPFHAHLTLGRVKHGGPGEVPLLEGLEEGSLGDCVIDEVVLYRSVLQRQGAEYSPLVCFPLAASQRGVEQS